ncbi:MAG: putative cytokinetic ring protein SteA [Actinomycetota bacterium]
MAKQPSRTAVRPGRLWRRRRDAGGIEASARVDRRTKDLIHRLRPGEIAVIDHEDLDRVSAEGLVERGVGVVVNARASITGRYPNTGPAILARAGVPLVDRAGAEVLDVVKEGERLTVRGGEILREGEIVAKGELLSGEELDRQLGAAHARMGEELEAFSRNTMAYLAQERELFLSGAGVPETRTQFDGQHALVVVRGYDYKRDLQILRGYMSEVKPVIVAVDGAADALMEEGFKPDIIIGDMDSVSTAALTSGAEVIVHAYPDGRAPGHERVRGLGIDASVFASGGTSEDIALLLAYERGADLIVAVGSHANLVEFLDKGRGGMASTFLVRLKVGPKLVDAKGVNRLYRPTVRTRDLMLLIGAALATWLIVALTSPAVRLWFEQMFTRIRNLF